MDSLHRHLWVLLALCLVAQKGLAMPAEEAEEDEDYLNDNDDDSNDEGDFDGPPPTITSKAERLEVMPGVDVLLPCVIHNGEKVSKLWKNGTQVLWLEDIKMTSDDRLVKFPNNSILIRHVKATDTGSYFCQVTVSPVLQVEHHISVISRPTIVRIQPAPDHGKVKILKKGDPLTLACEVTGFPDPLVTWTRKGNHRFPDGREKMEGTSITFEEVNRKYTGEYVCLATNKYGEAHESVAIHVEFAPEIEIEEETVTTTLGYEPEITCTVHASPPADVKWYKNGQNVDNRDRVLVSKNGNKHTLQIKGMNEADFGSYTCHATNAIGRNQRAIILSGHPTKPKMSVVSSDERHELRWSVESYAPIMEYDLQYRRADENSEWVKVQTVVTNAVEGNVFNGHEVLRDLTPAEYSVRIRAKNVHGWSPFSEDRVVRGGAASINSGMEALRPQTTAFVVLFLSISRLFI